MTGRAGGGVCGEETLISVDCVDDALVGDIASPGWDPSAADASAFSARTNGLIVYHSQQQPLTNSVITIGENTVTNRRMISRRLPAATCQSRENCVALRMNSSRLGIVQITSAPSALVATRSVGRNGGLRKHGSFPEEL